MKKIIPSFLIFIANYLTLYADSPLTSTPFWEAYKNEKIIVKAQQTGGVLTNELADFLISKKSAIDLKMAVINCLSWDINGKKNAMVFLNRLLEKNIYRNSTDFKTNGRADHLLCMAYLRALDNYFMVAEAFEWAELALKKKTDSYTYAIIHGLIKAQLYFDEDWCIVWQATNDVRDHKALKKDMKPQASDIIFSYMDLYKQYCN